MKIRFAEVLRLSMMATKLVKLEIKMDDIKEKYPKYWFDMNTNIGRHYKRILEKYCKLAHKFDRKEAELWWRSI